MLFLRRRERDLSRGEIYILYKGFIVEYIFTHRRESGVFIANKIDIIYLKTFLSRLQSKTERAAADNSFPLDRSDAYVNLFERVFCNT